ncbi:MAG: prepilin peptidase [Candidatus Woesearchaeota archaeon]
MFEILVALCFIALLIGSITDLQKREVADYITYGLFYAVIGVRLIFAILMQDWFIFFAGVAGALVFYFFGYLLYMTGQWGGGDVKMLAAIGGALPTYELFSLQSWFFGIEQLLPQALVEQGILFMPMFVLNIFLFGAIYAILWSFVLAIIKYRLFIPDFAKNWKAYSRIRYGIYGFFLASAVFVFWAQGTNSDLFVAPSIALISIALSILVGYFIVLFAKSVESSCMIQTWTIDKLTPGEWIQKDVWLKQEQQAPKTLEQRVLALQKQWFLQEFIYDSVLSWYRTFDLPQFFPKWFSKVKKKRKAAFLKKAQEQCEYEMHRIYQQILLHNQSISKQISIRWQMWQENEKYADARKRFFQAKTLSQAYDILKKGSEHAKTMEQEKLAHILKENGISFTHTRLCSPKDLGVTQEQIDTLKKTSISTMQVKIGIPFLPAFLIAFVYMLLVGSVFLPIWLFV